MIPFLTLDLETDKHERGSIDLSISSSQSASQSGFQQPANKTRHISRQVTEHAYQTIVDGVAKSCSGIHYKWASKWDGRVDRMLLCTSMKANLTLPLPRAPMFGVMKRLARPCQIMTDTASFNSARRQTGRQAGRPAGALWEQQACGRERNVLLYFSSSSSVTMSKRNRPTKPGPLSSFGIVNTTVSKNIRLYSTIKRQKILVPFHTKKKLLFK